MPAKPPANSVHSKSRAAWRTWLHKHHEQEMGVWLISYKKATGKARMEYEDIVEEALCFGWIDSTARTLDDERTMLYVAPRKKGSGWSRPNKERIERLLAAGLMEPAGLARIQAAKRDGSWSKLDSVEALEVPRDLATALARYKEAAANFEAFPRSAKRGILEWIVNARKPETGQKRIDETARLAARNERANQWRPRSD